MNSFISLVFLVSLSLMGGTAVADSSVPDSFISSGMEIPLQLQRKGYRRFGDLGISSLLKNIKRVNIDSQRTVRFKKRDGSVRSSAMWKRVRSGAQITVSEEMWEATPEEIQPMISLHEYLGALGFNDENYNLSSSLWLLSTSKANSLTRAEKKVISDYISQRSSSNGGIIGVGGGGDMGALWLKLSTLESQLKDLVKLRNKIKRRQKLNLMLIVMDMGTEIKWSKK